MYHYAGNSPVRYVDPDGNAERPAYSNSYGKYDVYTPIQNVDTGNSVADFALAVGASTLNLLGGCLNVISNGVGETFDLINQGIDYLDENIPYEYTLSGHGVKQDFYAFEAVGMANPQLVAEGFACLSIVKSADFSALGKIGLSKNLQKHILSRHSLNGLRSQYGRAPLQKLLNKTIFNTKWSDEKILKASQKAINKAVKKGVMNGTYSTKIYGETVTVQMQDGIPQTVYGATTVTEEMLK